MADRIQRVSIAITPDQLEYIRKLMAVRYLSPTHGLSTAFAQIVEEHRRLTQGAGIVASSKKIQ